MKKKKTQKKITETIPLSQVETTNNTATLQWSHVFNILLIGYILLTTLFYFLGYLAGLDQRIRGVDSVYYYIYLPSLFFDGDIDFSNELARLYPPGLEQLTEKGLPQNVFSIGPAIFWAPFFLLAHLLTMLAPFFGISLAADGFSSIYQFIIYVANSFYGLVGLFLITLILKHYVKPLPALLAVLGILFASQLTYYFWSFTAMSHNISLASTALFLLLWLTRGISLWTALAAALMILARWQNALFLLPLMITFLVQMTSAIRSKKGDWKILWQSHLKFGVVLFLGLTPQFLIWWILYGQWILIPQGTGFIDFTHLPLFSILFSWHHGLFSWHPLLFFGLVGLYWLWEKQKLLTLSLISIFILQWILNAAVTDWWASWSFGHRRFISLLPIFALGLALLFSQIQRVSIYIAALLLIVSLSIWNQLFIYQYMTGLIPRSKDLTFQQMFVDKFYLTDRLKLKNNFLSAIHSLNRKDILGLKKHATLAYESNPSHVNAHMIYGLSCLLSNDAKVGFQVFKDWHELVPKDTLARYGLAEYFIREGQNEAAANLFLNCSAEEFSLCQTITQKIQNKKTTLLDQDFFDLYRHRLERVIKDYRYD